jgi:hypothetical protein
MQKIMRITIFAVCAGLAWNASADQAQTPAAARDTPSQTQDAAVPAPIQVEQPMNMDEPMETGMMKPGMMKGDVKKSAEKKDEKMKEMLEKEQESMPPMPARETKEQ